MATIAVILGGGIVSKGGLYYASGVGLAGLLTNLYMFSQGPISTDESGHKILTAGPLAYGAPIFVALFYCVSLMLISGAIVVALV